MNQSDLSSLKARGRKRKQEFSLFDADFEALLATDPDGREKMKKTDSDSKTFSPRQPENDENGTKAPRMKKKAEEINDTSFLGEMSSPSRIPALSVYKNPENNIKKRRRRKGDNSGSPPKQQNAQDDPKDDVNKELDGYKLNDISSEIPGRTVDVNISSVPKQNHRRKTNKLQSSISNSADISKNLEQNKTNRENINKTSDFSSKIPVPQFPNNYADKTYDQNHKANDVRKDSIMSSRIPVPSLKNNSKDLLNEKLKNINSRPFEIATDRNMKEKSKIPKPASKEIKANIDPYNCYLKDTGSPSRIPKLSLSPNKQKYSYDKDITISKANDRCSFDLKKNHFITEKKNPLIDPNIAIPSRSNKQFNHPTESQSNEYPASKQKGEAFRKHDNRSSSYNVFESKIPKPIFITKVSKSTKYHRLFSKDTQTFPIPGIPPLSVYVPPLKHQVKSGDLTLHPQIEPETNSRIKAIDMNMQQVDFKSYITEPIYPYTLKELNNVVNFKVQSLLHIAEKAFPDHVKDEALLLTTMASKGACIYEYEEISRRVRHLRRQNKLIKEGENNHLSQKEEIHFLEKQLEETKKILQLYGKKCNTSLNILETEVFDEKGRVLSMQAMISKQREENTAMANIIEELRVTNANLDKRVALMTKSRYVESISARRTPLQPIQT